MLQRRALGVLYIIATLHIAGSSKHRLGMGPFSRCHLKRGCE